MTTDVDRGDDFLPTDDDAPEKQDDTPEVEAAGDKGEDKAKDDAADDKGDDKAEAKDAADDKADDGKKGDKKEKVIPESRFTEAIRKHKDRQERLEARIKELEAVQSSTRTSADIQEIKDALDKLQDEYDAARDDNHKEKAKAIRTKMRAAEDALIDLKATEKASAAKAETLEELRYEAAIAKVEADFPVINPDDKEHFDADVANEVLDLRNSLMKNGIPAAKALARAVKYVLGEPGKPGPGVDPKADRERTAREKAAEAAKKMPPDTTRVGLDSDRAGGDPKGSKSVAKMSQEQFRKLDEETLSKLRGDVL